MFKMSNSNQNSKNIPKKFKKYIFYNHGSFAVKNDKNTIWITFGRFKSEDVACAATGLLIKHDWNMADVANDLIFFYNEKAYTFKVMNNTLIFDLKFDSIEEAANHVEINSRCNDYHNDIFKKFSKKKGYKNRYAIYEEYNPVSNYENIFEKSGKFIVTKTKTKNSWIYGEFNSIDEAVAARKLLIDNNWKLDDGKEILFFNEMYWTFEIEGGILKFNGKFDSYEDALDILNPSKPQKKDFTNPFLKSVEDNFDKVISKPKPKSKPKRKSSKKIVSKKPKRNNLTYWDMVRENIKIKTSVDISKIWNPPIQINNIENKKIRIFVERVGDNVKNLFSILDFTFFNKQVQCIVDGTEIKWKDRNTVKIDNFSEFQLIISILEINGWNLSRINNSSSIYYYEGSYYKVHVVDNTIVFGMYSSYNSAENTLLIYKARPITNSNYVSLKIDKVGNKYEFVKIQNGNAYITNSLKSLEEVKAIRDILIHSNWDFSIFDKYDLFYLNGFYWEIICTNHIIYLIEKYELIKTY